MSFMSGNKITTLKKAFPAKLEKSSHITHISNLTNQNTTISPVNTSKISHKIDNINRNYTNINNQKKSIENNINKIISLAKSPPSNNVNFNNNTSNCRNIYNNTNNYNTINASESITCASANNISNCNNIKNDNISKENKEKDTINKIIYKNKNKIILSLKSDDLQFNNTSSTCGRNSYATLNNSNNNQENKKLNFKISTSTQINNNNITKDKINAKEINYNNYKDNTGSERTTFTPKNNKTRPLIANHNPQINTINSIINTKSNNNANISSNTKFSNKYNKINKKLPKNLMSINMNSTFNTSDFSNSQSKTPCSYQGKPKNRFLYIKKLKEPASTKNIDNRPFSAMFNSFEISKEAMSLEVDGNDSYDYFKHCYSQIISEKQLEAEKESKNEDLTNNNCIDYKLNASYNIDNVVNEETKEENNDSSEKNKDTNKSLKLIKSNLNNKSKPANMIEKSLNSTNSSNLNNNNNKTFFNFNKGNRYISYHSQHNTPNNKRDKIHFTYMNFPTYIQQKNLQKKKTNDTSSNEKTIGVENCNNKTQIFGTNNNLNKNKNSKEMKEEKNLIKVRTNSKIHHKNKNSIIRNSDHIIHDSLKIANNNNFSNSDMLNSKLDKENKKNLNTNSKISTNDQNLIIQEKNKTLITNNRINYSYGVRSSISSQTSKVNKKKVT